MLRLITGFLAGLCICICYAQDDTIVITATRFPDSKPSKKDARAPSESYQSNASTHTQTRLANPAPSKASP